MGRALSRWHRSAPARWAGGLLLSLLVWAAVPLAARAAEVAVVHEVRFPQRHNQYVEVESVFPADGEFLDLAMASWTPGSYLIRDFSAHVENLEARDANARALGVRKLAKNRWRVETAGAGRIAVRYSVWAGELNVATSWVESGVALLNGAGIFLYSEATRDRAQELTVRLPAGWSESHCALPRSASNGSYLAANFDELIDSPVVAGNLSRFDFEVRGQPYALLLHGGGGLWDGPRARDDLARLVAAQQDFWGVNPFRRDYLFFNFLIGPFGGLEHDHSTVMMADRWQMAGRKDYIKWLGLASHEFFHAWNVRRMRPAALNRYDYDREVYTEELWLAEGLSSYYDDLLLFRAGLIDVADYFELLAQEIRHYEAMPGRQVRSAQRASFDTWIKQYKPDENSINSTVSYYRKGALIGFVTDTAIRRETRNRASLDDVMREMYRRYGPEGEGGGAYPPGAFEQVVEDTAGAGVRSFVEDLLGTTEDPDVDAALDYHGLVLDREPPALFGADGDRAPGDLGISWVVRDSQLFAEQVVLGFAGAEVGVLPGDELLAIDGIRLTPANYEARLQRLQPGQAAEMTLSRHDRLLMLPITVQKAMPETYVIRPRPNIRRSEKEHLSAWLGRELQFNN